MEKKDIFIIKRACWEYDGEYYEVGFYEDGYVSSEEEAKEIVKNAGPFKGNEINKYTSKIDQPAAIYRRMKPYKSPLPPTQGE